MNDHVVRGIRVDQAVAAGCDPAALRRAFDLLADWVADGTLPGAAALVARGGRLAGEAYLGLAAPAEGRAVDSDTIWSLASITKPVTAAAAMQLVEAGLVGLDEPITALLPEQQQAPAGVADRQSITLRHLLSHTAGLPGVAPDNLDLRRQQRPLADFVRSFGQQPLLFTPGTAFYYSNPGILLAAELVGRAAIGRLGRTVPEPAIDHYHAVVSERLLAPLAMTSSSLQPPAAWQPRLAWVSGTGQEGQSWEMANSAYYRQLGIPWGGLFSRPRDLVRFVDLFLPAAAGRSRLAPSPAQSLLAPATIRAMTTIQCEVPDAPMTLAPELRDHPLDHERPRVPWGLGWEVKGDWRRGHPTGELTGPATFSHLGASGTMAWGEPAADLVCILLTNRTLRTGWASQRPRQALFSNAVMAAVR